MTTPVTAVAGRAVLPGSIVGVGVDAVDVERYRRVLQRTPGIAARTFSDAELAYARAQVDPTQRLAARFAAKEATMKALGVGLGSCKLREIEVGRHDGGQPYLVLHGAAARLAAERSIGGWLVTMTHTDLVAIAYVTATAS